MTPQTHYRPNSACRFQFANCRQEAIIAGVRTPGIHIIRIQMCMREVGTFLFECLLDMPKAGNRQASIVLLQLSDGKCGMPKEFVINNTKY